MVTGVHKPWAVSGDNRPLAQRWEAASAQLVRLGGVVSWMMSESCLVDMQAEIARLTKAKTAEVWDQRLVDARCDFTDQIAIHQQTREKIIKEARQLEPVSDEHRLLGDISAAMLRKPEETQACVDRLWPRVPRETGYNLPGEISKPVFDVDGYRSAMRLMAAENDKLRDILGDMAKIWQHDAMPMSDRNRRMIWKLYATVNAMAERIDYLEAITNTKPATRKRAS